MLCRGRPGRLSPAWKIPSLPPAWKAYNHRTLGRSEILGQHWTTGLQTYLTSQQVPSRLLLPVSPPSVVAQPLLPAALRPTLLEGDTLLLSWGPSCCLTPSWEGL